MVVSTKEQTTGAKTIHEQATEILAKKFFLNGAETKPQLGDHVMLVCHTQGFTIGFTRSGELLLTEQYKPQIYVEHCGGNPVFDRKQNASRMVALSETIPQILGCERCDLEYHNNVVSFTLG